MPDDKQIDYSASELHCDLAATSLGSAQVTLDLIDEELDRLDHPGFGTLRELLADLRADITDAQDHLLQR